MIMRCRRDCGACVVPRTDTAYADLVYLMLKIVALRCVYLTQSFPWLAALVNYTAVCEVQDLGLPRRD